MKNKNNGQTRRNTNHVCHGDGSSSQGQDREVPPGITHSISPGVPCPETVLVVVMSNGSYLLMGYPQGEPTALVVRNDAGPLRQALEGAFGTPADATASENGHGNGTRTITVPPEHKVLHITQAQP